jgi:hypothetical protein
MELSLGRGLANLPVWDPWLQIQGYTNGAVIRAHYIR